MYINEGVALSNNQKYNNNSESSRVPFFSIYSKMFCLSLVEFSSPSN